MTTESAPRMHYVVTNVYRDGSLEQSETVGIRKEANEAHALLTSYVMSLVFGGGVASYSRPHDEFKVVMPDGSTEYVRDHGIYGSGA